MTFHTGCVVLGALLVLPGIGCERRIPAPRPPTPVPAKVPVLNVRSLGTPSALIHPPPAPSASDALPFDLPLNQGYGIEGSWTGPSQVKGTYRFERIGDFTVKKGDHADVDPKDIAEVLEKWIASSGVQSTQSSGSGGMQRSIDYGTASTLGTITYTIRPDAPAKDVSFHLEIREQPRSTR
ncbi:MAG TPA: hypothetical protein VKW04_25480 [Planctomycetota bacterium]|nr:hypothetical protein [Planctomycetota bacterium]